jgi:hypothetical protein
MSESRRFLSESPWRVPFRDGNGAVFCRLRNTLRGPSGIR